MAERISPERIYWVGGMRVSVYGFDNLSAKNAPAGQFSAELYTLLLNYMANANPPNELYDIAIRNLYVHCFVTTDLFLFAISTLQPNQASLSFDLYLNDLGLNSQ